MPDINQQCVLPEGDDGMSCPTSFDRVCLPRAIMECHAQHRPTVCAAQGTFEHAMPDVIRPCVQSKGDDSMHAQRCPSVHVV